MIWNLIGTIGGKVLDIVDDVVEDKDVANRVKFGSRGRPVRNSAPRSISQTVSAISNFLKISAFTKPLQKLFCFEYLKGRLETGSHPLRMCFFSRM